MGEDRAGHAPGCIITDPGGTVTLSLLTQGMTIFLALTIRINKDNIYSTTYYTFLYFYISDHSSDKGCREERICLFLHHGKQCSQFMRGSW